MIEVVVIGFTVAAATAALVGAIHQTFKTFEK